MASFTVTNTNDSGAGSLRQALLDANSTLGADIIRFDSSLSGQVIRLTSGELTVADDLTIEGDLDGDGTPDITVARDSTAGNFRVFRISDGDFGSDKTVSFQGLTITGGMSREDGGGIFNYESLTLTNSIVSGNSTIGDFADGGGIFSSGNSLTLNNSTVSGNSTTGERSRGGGISSFYSTGGVVLNNSTVSGNSTSGEEAEGGGIFSEGSGDLTLNDSTVVGNATSGAFADGGGIFSEGSDLILKNSTVSDNSTTGDGADGGGIFRYAGRGSSRFDSKTVIADSKVSNNSTAGINADGGGISIEDNLDLSSSEVSNNSTTGDSAVGGGIYSTGNSSEKIILRNSDISDNSTAGDGSAGGGLYFSDNGIIIFSDSTVSGNSTAGQDGSGGGGIFLFANDDTTLINSTVSANSTVGRNSDGGGIEIRGSSSGSGYDVSLLNSTISGNSANSDGGGIALSDGFNSGELKIKNSIVSGNMAGLGDEIQVFPGTVSSSNSVLGDNSKTNAEAFVNLNTAGNITATIDGTNPTALDDIIAPLADNGGATLTHALVSGSPAINAGDNVNVSIDIADQDGDGNITEATPFDQRGSGFARIIDGTVDAGAVEQAAEVVVAPSHPLCLYGTDANDSLIGSGGDDKISGNGGHDYLVGGAGNDLIWGGSQADTILGGADDDIIYGNGDKDFIDSGSGLDQIWLGGQSDATVLLSEGEGYDWIANFQMGMTTLKGFAESDLTLVDSADGARISKGDDLLAVVPWKTVEMVKGSFVA